MQNIYKKDWIEGGDNFGALFWKKVSFLGNIERCPKFLD